MAGGLQEGARGGLSVEAAHYYARIYSAAKAGCLSVLRQAGCGEADAEDIFATTLERIMRKFDPADSAYGPAQTVELLKKACLQKLIDERRHRDVLSLVPLEDASADVGRGAEGPAEAAEEREAVAIGREAIASLPERDRAIFFQRHQLNLAPEEILRRNPGLSARTYRKVMQRANARALKAFGEIEGGVRCAQMRGELLRRYVAGEVSEAELALLECHLHRCRACRLETARMRHHLHDVASGLAAVLAVEWGHGGRVLGLSDAVAGCGHALAEMTRGARERLRELAFKATMSLPGAGGDAAAGQLAGVSALKAASACAAGALAVGCLAAGVVPGVGVIGLASHHRAPKPARRAASPTPGTQAPVKPTTPEPETNGPTHRPEKASSPDRLSLGGSRQAKKTHLSSAQTRPRPSAHPSASAAQTTSEFGVESAGSGVPSPSAPAEPSRQSPDSGKGEVSRSPSTPQPSRGDSGSSPEFGF